MNIINKGADLTTKLVCASNAVKFRKELKIKNEENKK